MPFEISITREFSAAHAIRLYNGMIEPVHGHNWRACVKAAAPKLDAIGVVMDFHELERRLDEIVSPMHNHNLNDLACFGNVNPTAENVALHIAEALRLPEGIKLKSVEVWETTNCSAIYLPSPQVD